MIGIKEADKYSSCLSCGSDKDVHAVIMQNPHSCNTLEVTLCRSCLLTLVEQMQYNGITSEGSYKSKVQNVNKTCSNHEKADDRNMITEVTAPDRCWVVLSRRNDDPPMIVNSGTQNETHATQASAITALMKKAHDAEWDAQHNGDVEAVEYSQDNTFINIKYKEPGRFAGIRRIYWVAECVSPSWYVSSPKEECSE